MGLIKEQPMPAEYIPRTTLGEIPPVVKNSRSRGRSTTVGLGVSVGLVLTSLAGCGDGEPQPTVTKTETTTLYPTASESLTQSPTTSRTTSPSSIDFSSGTTSLSPVVPEVSPTGTPESVLTIESRVVMDELTAAILMQHNSHDGLRQVGSIEGSSYGIERNDGVVDLDGDRNTPGKKTAVTSVTVEQDPSLNTDTLNSVNVRNAKRIILSKQRRGMPLEFDANGHNDFVVKSYEFSPNDDGTFTLTESIRVDSKGNPSSVRVKGGVYRPATTVLRSDDSTVAPEYKIALARFKQEAYGTLGVPMP